MRVRIEFGTLQRLIVALGLPYTGKRHFYKPESENNGDQTNGRTMKITTYQQDISHNRPIQIEQNLTKKDDHKAGGSVPSGDKQRS
jgi:hypothetical protein